MDASQGGECLVIPAGGGARQGGEVPPDGCTSQRGRVPAGGGTSQGGEAFDLLMVVPVRGRGCLLFP